jgi:nitrogen fixation protein FixH
MNWGKGLVIGLVMFMSFITILVVLMFRSAEDSFDKNYYEKGLAFDIDYQKKQQVITDNATPIIAYNDELITITFKDMDSGQVNFKKPSNQSDDRYINFTKNVVNISRKSILNGEWKVVLTWTANKKQYLYEQSIYLK